jgi:NtrC-family two-component system response regulator AlgB
MTCSPAPQIPGQAPGLPQLRALIIDDEKNIRVTFAACLEGLGLRVSQAATPEAALSAVEHAFFDLVFLDLRLGDTSGIDLVPKLLSLRPNLYIVLITAYATIENAVEAVKRGVEDYLPKPFTPAHIERIVERAAERIKLCRKVEQLEELLRDSVPGASLETSSPGMRAALDLLARAAKSEAPVLLRGENGTGKGVFARMLHAQSRRADRSFVVVNCPTLSDELLASELFGHAAGSFTGAVRDQVGRVEAAEGGILFLDEVSEISPGLQAKLLRFLQEKQFERLGENKTRYADVRVVAATNKNLEDEVAAGRFREDLLYRINVVEIVLPPLRERREDILPLATGFLEFFAKSAGVPVYELSPSAREALVSYGWPGNVRELKNVLERATIVWPSPRLEAEALPERISDRGARKVAIGGDFSLEAIEREHLLRVVARTKTVEEAAQILGIDASTLWRKRKRYETS